MYMAARLIYLLFIFDFLSRFLNVTKRKLKHINHKRKIEGSDLVNYVFLYRHFDVGAL